MKILITGATGYLGQNIIPEIVKECNSVQILTLNRNTEKAQKLFPYVQCTHISSTCFCEAKQFNPDLVFHLATLSSSRNNNEIILPMLEANIEFGVKLLSNIAQCKNLKLFINVGSFAEYRLGPDKIKDAYLYTATKSAFRNFVDYYSDLNKFKYVTVIPYTIYGGTDTRKKIIDYIYESINAEKPVKMTKGEQVLDFINVKDVVSFFVGTVKNFKTIISGIKNGEDFYLGTGCGTKIKDLAKKIEQIERKKCNIDWGALPYRDLDVMYAIAPTERNNKVFDWEAKISITEGIETNKKQTWE